ncbi:TonB-dependent receptor [candidate division KSB1 bacterium]|nr:TonB-dependent receptor [candidate division KSB1 bacterium]
MEFAVYAQDKLELGEIIANIGMRFDYFDPDGIVPVNPRARYNAVTGTLETPFVEASKKYQLSPRLGLAFPISDRGVIHVSYGHFLQIPQFQYMYYNSEFEISSGFKETIMGNADLEPERTVAYEVGLQQGLSESFGLELTIYSKDIRNLLGQEIFDTIDERTYFRYTNRDYGNVKGVTVSVEKKPLGFLSGRLDYTFQVARGNASDPNAIYLANQSTRPAELEKQVVPLDWDETHSINGNIRIGKSNDWTVSFIGRLGTGLPYTAETPQEQQIETQFENNERKPMRTNVDIFAQKYFKLGTMNLIMFARAFNIFDTMNHIIVYPSTGRADRTFRWPEEERIASANGVYSLNEVDNRPHWFSEPRKIQLGVALEF